MHTLELILIFIYSRGVWEESYWTQLGDFFFFQEAFISDKPLLSLSDDAGLILEAIICATRGIFAPYQIYIDAQCCGDCSALEWRQGAREEISSTRLQCSLVLPFWVCFVVVVVVVLFKIRNKFYNILMSIECMEEGLNRQLDL